jgi:O-antigen/teichoic acid export membrane protein
MTPSPSSRHHTKRRILRNTVANSVAQAATMLSTLIFLPLLIRSFGLPVYGVMALSSSVATYAVLLDLGVSATLVRLVAERTAKDDQVGATRAMFSAVGIYSVLGVAVALIMFVLGVFAGSLFRVSPSEAELLRILLWIGAATQLWYWPTSVARDGLCGLQRYDLVSGATFVVVLGDIVGTIYVLVSHQGPVVLLSIRAAEVVVASLINLVLLTGVLPKAARRVSASVADVRAILKSGSSIFALQVAQVMSRQQTDKVVLAVFLGPAAVAIYDIAAKLNSLISTFIGLTVSAVLPVAAELNASEQHDALRSLFLRGTKIVATLIAPLVTILIVIAAPFIAAWCGPQYATAVPVAQILLLSQALLPLYQLADQILIGKNRFHLWVPGGLTMAFVNVILSVALVQTLGIVGVALGTLGAVMVEFPWYASVFGKEMDLPIGDWLLKTAWPMYPLLIVPAAIAHLGGRTMLGASIIGLAVVAAIAATVYWAITLGLGYSRVERADLLSIVHRASREGVA